MNIYILISSSKFQFQTENKVTNISWKLLRRNNLGYTLLCVRVWHSHMMMVSQVQPNNRGYTKLLTQAKLHISNAINTNMKKGHNNCSSAILYHYPCPDGAFAALAAHLYFKATSSFSPPLFFPNTVYRPLRLPHFQFLISIIAIIHVFLFLLLKLWFF